VCTGKEKKRETQLGLFTIRARGSDECSRERGKVPGLTFSSRPEKISWAHLAEERKRKGPVVVGLERRSHAAPNQTSRGKMLTFQSEWRPHKRKEGERKGGRETGNSHGALLEINVRSTEYSYLFCALPLMFVQKKKKRKRKRGKKRNQGSRLRRTQILSVGGFPPPWITCRIREGGEKKKKRLSIACPLWPPLFGEK